MALGLAGALALASAASAGVLGFGPWDKQIGDTPVAITVTLDDRVVAAIQATSTPVVGWFDTQDWRDDAAQWGVDGLTDLRCIESAGDASAPILLVGGDAIGILNVSSASSPATLEAGSSLGLSGGTVADLAWDPVQGVAYGADDESNVLHWIPVTGAGGAVDSETGWPLPLTFTPHHLVMVSEETLLVGGDDEGSPAAALVDLDGGTPSVESLDLDGVSGALVAASADGDVGWLLVDDGSLIRVEKFADGDDDDSAGDDDDSAGDDDDSAGDDDDSVGDDDDSVGDDDDSGHGDDDDSGHGDDDDSAVGDDDDSGHGDDDDSAFGDDDDSGHGDDDDSGHGDDDDSASARSGSLDLVVFLSEAPEDPVDLLARDGVLYALGGNTVVVLDPDSGDATDIFSLAGNGSALAGSSADDGHVYVALEDLGVVSVLGPGPFVDILTVSDTSIPVSEDLEITLVTGAPATSGTCTLSATIDGTIAGDGTPLTLAETESTLGATTTVTIPGGDLEPGSHRLHVFCGDGIADGRASLGYYVGDLEAPSEFSVTASEGRVTVSWLDNDDEAVASYDVLFSETSFSDGDEPVGSNTDGTQTSPLSVPAPSDTVGEETLTQEITSLTNGTTYYFAVAAVDGGGSRGPYTEVLPATPNVTGGVAAITGDPGCTCAYPAAGGSGRPVLLLPLLLLAARRRRRPGVTR